jgi:D-arabinose 1-dehydrogenase-like Zn-dependent alcohol dehydrogenase
MAPVVRQFGKGSWRVFDVRHSMHGALHFIGSVHAEKVTKPHKTTVYHAYSIRNEKIGTRYTLKEAVDLTVKKDRQS